MKKWGRAKSLTRRTEVQGGHRARTSRPARGSLRSRRRSWRRCPRWASVVPDRLDAAWSPTQLAWHLAPFGKLKRVSLNIKTAERLNHLTLFFFYISTFSISISKEVPAPHLPVAEKSGVDARDVERRVEGRVHAACAVVEPVLPRLLAGLGERPHLANMNNCG